MKAWILAAATLTCSSVLADETRPATAKSAATFEMLDKNADRQISRTEAGPDRALSNGFALLDSNGDGFLSPEEYAARTKS